MVAKVQNELDLVAKDMIEQAKQNPLDVTKPLMSTGPTEVKRINVDNIIVKLMFSYDVFPGGKAVWHLSESTGDVLPDSVLAKIKKAFFKDAEIIEMPSVISSKVKQYLSKDKT